MELKKVRTLYQVKIINGGENHPGKYLYDFLETFYDNDKIVKQEITQGDIDEFDKLQIEKFLKDINSNQLKLISDINKEKIKLQDEMKTYKDIAQKESMEKMILQTELLTAKKINDEIYAENKKLKESNERIVKDMVKLDENIVNLNAQIVTLKKGK